MSEIKWAILIGIGYTLALILLGWAIYYVVINIKYVLYQLNQLSH